MLNHLTFRNQYHRHIEMNQGDWCKTNAQYNHCMDLNIFEQESTEHRNSPVRDLQFYLVLVRSEILVRESLPLR